MIRAFPGHEAVRVPRIQREIRSAVLQRDPRARDHDPGAEARVVGLDPGDHVAFPVRAAHIHGAALGRDPVRPDLRPVRHLRRARRAVFGRKKIMIIDPHMFRIGHIPERVRERHLHRLQLPVAGGRRQTSVEGEFLQDVQRHERHDPLSVGRDLTDVVSPVTHPDRFHPERLVRRKIFKTQITALFSALFIDLPGKPSGVKRRRICLPDLLERIRKIRQADHLPRLIRSSKRGERIEPRGKTGIVSEGKIMPVRILPRSRKIRSAGISLPRVACRRLQRLRQRQFPETLTDLCPRHGYARHRDRRPAVSGNLSFRIRAVRQIPLDRSQLRRLSGGIESVKFSVLRGPDERERVSTRAVRRRLRNCQRGSGSHRSVHGVSSPPQDLEPRGRSLRNGAVDHAARGVDRKTLRRINLGKRIK